MTVQEIELFERVTAELAAALIEEGVPAHIARREARLAALAAATDGGSKRGTARTP